MDEQRPLNAGSAHVDAMATGVLSGGQADVPLSQYASSQAMYNLENLESPNPAGALVGSGESSFRKAATFSRRRALIISAVITLVVTFLSGASILILARHGPKSSSSNHPSVATQDVNLKNAALAKLPNDLQGNANSLLVNGDVVTRGSIKLSNNGYVTILRLADPNANQTFTLPNTSGALCLDSNNCGYATTADLQQVRAALGQIVVPTVPASVLSLNGQAGALSIQGVSNQINVSTAGGVITLATPQDLGIISSPSFANLNLSGNLALSGTLTLPVDCSTQINGGALTTNGLGQIICSDDDGGSSTANVSTTTGGTTGSVPLFTSSQNIEDSLISQALGTITINGALVANSLSLASALSVPNGGTGATSLNSNAVLIGNGAGAISAVSAGGAGLCLTSTAGAPVFQACPGSGGVSSVNSITGAVAVQGTTNEINVVNGSSTITLSTPQPISTTSSPTFAGLTINGLATGVVKSSSGTLSVSNINLASEVTGTLPLANGGTGLNSTPTNGQLLIGNGTNYSLSTLSAGAGINIANAAGSITISSPGSGTCSTCADRTLNNLSSVAINTSLLPGTTGIDLGSNIRSFQDLYLSGSGSGSFRFTGTPTANQIVTFPNASGTVCLDTGNCAGAGGGVTSGGGTSGKLAKFTGSTSIGDSLLSESGALVTLAGSLTINSNLTVSGLLTSGTINGLTLQSNTNGFHISGGTTPATLTVTTSSTLNQNLRTTDSPTFAGLTLSTPLTVTNGGTGVSGTPTNGELLIGNGSGYSISTLTAGSGVTITNNSGSITVAAPAAGSCPTTCADRSLSNLSGVSINTALLPDNTQTINLGSTTRPFQALHLNDTAGSQGFLLTGHNTGSEVTLTLPVLNGTLALVQTTGSSSAQSGDINIANNIIGNRIISTLLGSADAASTSNVMLRSGNASGGNSGNLTIDAGTATATAGSITVAGSNASALQLGRSGLQVTLPGGLSTLGGNIATANGNLDLGSGTITSGNINGQTIDSTLSIFTGSLWVQGNNLVVGSDANNIDGTLTFVNGNGNSATLAIDTNVTSDYQIFLPAGLPASTACLTLDNSGVLDTQSCGSGLGGSGTDNTIALFTGGGTSLADSLLTQSGTVVSILGTANSLNVNGSITSGLNGGSGAAGAFILNDGSNPGRALTLQNQQAGNSYTLQLPTTADVGSTCLTLVNVSAGVNRITGGSCAAGGSGGNVNLSGTVSGYLLRGTANGPNYTAAASLIQDDGNTIGINTTPQTDLLSVGSANAFRVTDAGAISAAASITSSGVIQTSAANQALTVSGAPTNTATQSLVQVGGAIASGNTATNGGTYIGLNAPNSGAGSAADFLNLQKNGVSKLKVDNTGAITSGTVNGLTLQSNATGFQIAGGTAVRTLSVTANATIDQNVATGSSVSFGSLALTSSALAPAYGGTGILGGPTADGQLLIGASGGTYTRSTLTAGAGVNISNGAGSITISAPGSGTCSSCADRQLSNLTGTTSVPVDLLGVTAGTINLGSASVPFKYLYLAGDSASPGSRNFKLTGTATTTRTITIPDATDTICLHDLANCAGVGGGITGSGTTNTVPKFTASSTIGNSNITDNGTTVGITGALSVSTNASISGTITSGAINGLTLQSNTTGFQISGGTSSKTLTVENNTALDQNLRTTDSPTFAGLSLTTALTVGNGGTGNSGTPTNGQLLIGNGTNYTRSTLTAGAGVNISNGAGSITISAPGSGTCAACADTGLTNLASVAVNTSLLAGVTNSIDLGSSGFTWRSGYFGTNLNTPVLQSSSTLSISSASGSNLSVTSGTSGAVSLDSGTTGNVNIGTGSNAKTVTIGNSTGATSVVINTGTNGVSIGDNAVTKTIKLGGNTSDSADTIQIATNGTSADTVTIGSTNSSSTVILQGGAHTLSITNSAITLNNGGAKVISVNQASSGAGNSLTIQAGQGASGTNNGGDLILQGGARGNASSVGGAVIVKPQHDSTASFMVQTSSGTRLLEADTSNAIPRLIIAQATPTWTNARLIVSTVEVTTGLRIGTSTDGVSVNDGNGQNLRFTGVYRNTVKATLKPEYEGATFRGDGTSNTGYLTSAYCSNEGSLSINTTQCGTSGEDHSYYEWTHNETTDQDYDIILRWYVPDNFDSAGTFSTDEVVRGFSSKSASSTDNNVTMSLYNNVGAQCGSTTNITNSTANQWGAGTTLSGTAGDSDCDNIDAGEYVTFVIHMTANSTGTTGEIIRMGEIEISYKSTF